MPEVFFALVLLSGLGLATGFALAPWWRRRRRARIAAQPFPARWRTLLRRRVPLLARLPADQQLRLKALMQIFLAEKRFIGCAGLVVTDEMRVTIAAQACLPLLGAARGVYPKLTQILLYPGAFAVQRPVTLHGGVVQEQRRALLGESWGEGQVILSWQDALQGAALPHDGRNVVIHEFAHQLDQAKGVANGAPWQADAAARQAWAEGMQAEFDALQAALGQGQATLLDPYAATDPAEFFAVASEVYFEQGAALREAHPQLFLLLAGYYRVNSAAWTA